MSVQSGALAARESLTTRPASAPPESRNERTNRQLGLYTYAYFNPVPSLTVTAGVSFDSIDNAVADEEAANPKLGITWRPTPYTTVRAAALETLFGSLTTSTQNAQPRLEPVQVAGFTQLLFGGTADRGTVRGLAIEQELSPKLFVGWQADTRDTERTGVNPVGPPDTILIDLSERAQRAYLYWLPVESLSVTARYEHGRYASEPLPLLGYSHMKTERLPLEIRYFARGGFTIGARASYVQQEGRIPERFPANAVRSPAARVRRRPLLRVWTRSSVIACRIGAASCP